MLGTHLEWIELDPVRHHQRHRVASPDPQRGAGGVRIVLFDVRFSRKKQDGVAYPALQLDGRWPTRANLPDGLADGDSDGPVPRKAVVRSQDLSGPADRGWDDGRARLGGYDKGAHVEAA